jgi:hypothetical protein
MAVSLMEAGRHQQHDNSGLCRYISYKYVHILKQISMPSDGSHLRFLINAKTLHAVKDHKSIFQQEEFEDTKWVIKIRKPKDKQHNGQRKKYKRTNNDLQNIYIKLKIEHPVPH